MPKAVRGAAPIRAIYDRTGLLRRPVDELAAYAVIADKSLIVSID